LGEGKENDKLKKEKESWRGVGRGPVKENTRREEGKDARTPGCEDTRTRGREDGEGGEGQRRRVQTLDQRDGKTKEADVRVTRDAETNPHWPLLSSVCHSFGHCIEDIFFQKRIFALCRAAHELIVPKVFQARSFLSLYCTRHAISLCK
jgi:DNA-binding XRE family transcriptional regulator